LGNTENFDCNQDVDEQIGQRARSKNDDLKNNSSPVFLKLIVLISSHCHKESEAQHGDADQCACLKNDYWEENVDEGQQAIYALNVHGNDGK
jgi:hypothetical protein